MKPLGNGRFRNSETSMLRISSMNHEKHAIMNTSDHVVSQYLKKENVISRISILHFSKFKILGKCGIGGFVQSV